MAGLNGHTAQITDEQIDVLYHFWPGTTTPPPPLPEAAFSLTLKGTLDGHETLLTVRGQTPAEFQRNLTAVRGLLDQPQTPASQGEGWCHIHNVQMRQTTKEGRSWWSHKTDQGWCKGR